MGAPLVSFEEAAEILSGGGVVGLPTETVWGIAARLIDHDAVARIFEIKGRSHNTPLQVLVADMEQAGQLAHLDGPAIELLRRHAPGALTVIAPAREPLPQIGGTGATVGIRIPDHPTAAALLALTGPLAATSANLTGEPELTTAAEVAELPLDAVLATDVTPAGRASTVVDATSDPPQVIRKGSVEVGW